MQSASIGSAPLVEIISRNFQKWSRCQTKVSTAKELSWYHLYPIAPIPIKTTVGKSVSQWQFQILLPTAAEHFFAAVVFFINSQKKETDKKYLGSLNISWPPLKVVLYFMNVCFIFSQLFFSWFLCSCLHSFQTSEFIHPHSDQERRWPKRYFNGRLPLPIILSSYFC